MRGSISRTVTCVPKRDTNGSGADDRERLRDGGHLEDFDVGEDGIVRGESGQHAGFGAGGDEDVLGFERLSAFGAFDLDFAAAFDGAEACDDVDLVLLHEELDALGVLGDDFVFAVDGLGVVEDGLVE